MAAWKYFGPVEPTPEEARWLKRAARVMADCPPTLLLYTQGDKCILVAREGMIPDENKDMCDLVEQAGAMIGSIPCAVRVHSVAG
jgi:hypothetical protein